MARSYNRIFNLATCAALLLTGCAQSPPPRPTASVKPASCFMCGGPTTFLVFFDWNSDRLTPTTTLRISQFSSANRTAPFTEIHVSGHTDSTGSVSYNAKLSLKRAQAVARQLILDGVPKTKITLFAYGDTFMLVPTPPNVSDHRNRYVEIEGFSPGMPVPVQPYHTGPVKVLRLKHGILLD